MSTYRGLIHWDRQTIQLVNENEEKSVSLVICWEIVICIIDMIKDINPNFRRSWYARVPLMVFGGFILRLFIVRHIMPFDVLWVLLGPAFYVLLKAIFIRNMASTRTVTETQRNDLLIHAKPLFICGIILVAQTLIVGMLFAVGCYTGVLKGP